jgi:hypothetical protein
MHPSKMIPSGAHRGPTGPITGPAGLPLPPSSLRFGYVLEGSPTDLENRILALDSKVVWSEGDEKSPDPWRGASSGLYKQTPWFNHGIISSLAIKRAKTRVSIRKERSPSSCLVHLVLVLNLVLLVHLVVRSRREAWRKLEIRTCRIFIIIIHLQQLVRLQQFPSSYIIIIAKYFIQLLFLTLHYLLDLCSYRVL